MVGHSRGSRCSHACSCKAFERQLAPVMNELNLTEVVINMGDCEWIALAYNQRIDATMFNAFVAALKLHYLDYLFIAGSPLGRPFVVVLDARNDTESFYHWMYWFITVGFCEAIKSESKHTGIKLMLRTRPRT